MVLLLLVRAGVTGLLVRRSCLDSESERMGAGFLISSRQVTVPFVIGPRSFERPRVQAKNA